MRSWMTLALALAACGGHDVSRTIGARCDVVSECDGRCLGPSGEFPDGFCSLDCSTNNDCPGGTACIDAEGGACLFECSVTADCEFLGPAWSCKEDKLRESDAKVSVCRGD